MYTYKYINTKDPLYQLVLELRYNNFFKRFNLRKDIVLDEDENIAFHLVCAKNNILYNDLYPVCRTRS